MTPALAQTKKGMILAVRYCGAWPVCAALDEYVAAAQRAEREVDRAVETWQRWRRRFDPDPDCLEIGSGRVNVRHAIATAMLDHLSEKIRIMTGPAEGSA